MILSLNLYQSGKMGVEGVLVCTLSALSSFGPVVALANLGVGLTQVFASADRVLDLLEEEPEIPVQNVGVVEIYHCCFSFHKVEHRVLPKNHTGGVFYEEVSHYFASDIFRKNLRGKKFH